MSKVQFAAIDIGSNAVRLLIKSASTEDTEDKLQKLLMVRVPLRLGQESFVNGKISSAKEKKLIKLMKAFKHLMSVYDVESVRACATSAMRDAKNAKSLVKEIYKSTDIQIEVIDGKEEADIIYQSHFADTLNKKNNYIFVDVGGGSTEISLVVEGEMTLSLSYNIGTVRLLNNMVDEAEYERMYADLAEIASQHTISDIVGSGGNIIKLNTLASVPRNAKLSLKKLENLYETMKLKTVDELIETYKLRPDRADVIVPAASIYINIAKAIKVERFIVPKVGLADGLTHILFENWKNKKGKKEAKHASEISKQLEEPESAEE
jgi:exopolyphosphatase/guanosine-5'-triphosphate,3'-diphosphate pyrophosphatase